MDLQKLEAVLQSQNQPKFRTEQLKKAIYQDGISSFTEISNIPKDLREILVKEMGLLSFEVQKVLVTKDGQSMKALLKLSDGNLIEAVLIAPKPDVWSVCISCQVGCAIGCKFCATGKMGLKRNLTAEEITDQVLFWIQYLKNINQKISTVVFMGMGEPLLNWEQVSRSLRDLIDPTLFG
ncbi:MAG: radical SAM protein, partial [Candidatus Moranbacteria bacterium]|nr:radical SAM protein [Candidatus Moranbacteria bacterium]